MVSAVPGTVENPVHVIPVLDLKNGVVVHGIAGQRDRYQPLQSRLTPGSDPVEIAEAIRDRFGWNTFYIADLDGIISGRPRFDLHTKLIKRDFRLMIDTGAREPEDAHRVLQLGAEVIIGLETWTELESLRTLMTGVAAESVLFSLDLKHGQPQCGSNWTDREPLHIARHVASVGVTRIIVLDVAAVGTGRGVPTLPLCRKIAGQLPGVRLITGGGLRTSEDLPALRSEPLEGVLVATAIHTGAWERVKDGVPR